MNNNIFNPIQVVDLFAGPGGVGEGLSSFGSGTDFQIIVSAEKDVIAHKTLRLRAFYRLLKNENIDALDDYYNYCNGASPRPLLPSHFLRPVKSSGISQGGRLAQIDLHTKLGLS